MSELGTLFPWGGNYYDAMLGSQQASSAFQQQNLYGLYAAQQQHAHATLGRPCLGYAPAGEDLEIAAERREMEAKEKRLAWEAEKTAWEKRLHVLRADLEKIDSAKDGDAIPVSRDFVQLLQAKPSQNEGPRAPHPPCPSCKADQNRDGRFCWNCGEQMSIEQPIQGSCLWAYVLAGFLGLLAASALVWGLLFRWDLM